MAEELHLTGGVKQFSWWINAGSPFTTEFYQEAGITTSNFTNGKTRPSPILSTCPPWASGTGTNTEEKTVTYNPGTYTIYGYLWAQNGTYYKVGPESVTVQDDKTPPPAFAWSTSPVAGDPLTISALDWNTLTKDINLMLEYMGWDKVTFTQVESGTTISASIVNEAIGTLNSMTQSMGNPLTKVNQGDTIYASTFVAIAKRYEDKRKSF